VHEEKELSLARFASQLAESRTLVDAWLDLYQIHSATAESGCLQDGALLAALVDRRRRGAYRAVGLTLSGATSARTLELARDAHVDGEPVFDVVQATFNVLEPSLAGAPAAHDAGIGVTRRVFANGRQPTQCASAMPGCSRLRDRAGMPLDQIAAAFAPRIVRRRRAFGAGRSGGSRRTSRRRA
jgi:aryl-alcohol dehydrogenase-like predicted oxidoreductase